jgi:hypothetical protein
LHSGCRVLRGYGVLSINYLDYYFPDERGCTRIIRLNEAENSKLGTSTVSTAVVMRD